MGKVAMTVVFAIGAALPAGAVPFVEFFGPNVAYADLSALQTAVPCTSAKMNLIAYVAADNRWYRCDGTAWVVIAATSAVLTVRKNSGADVGSRPRLNLIEGSNVTMTVADDSLGNEIDVTVNSTGGGGGGSPAGPLGSLQYNLNGSAFGGVSKFTTDGQTVVGSGFGAGQVGLRLWSAFNTTGIGLAIGSDGGGTWLWSQSDGLYSNDGFDWDMKSGTKGTMYLLPNTTGTNLYSGLALGLHTALRFSISSTQAAASTNDVGLRHHDVANVIRVFCGEQRSDWDSYCSMIAKFWGTLKGANVSSASTITPTAGLFHVTGTAAIDTINPPWTGFTGCIDVIPDAAFTTTTNGNVALASTAIAGRVLRLCCDGSSWYPSY